MGLLHRIRCKLIEALGGHSDIYVNGLADDYYHKGIADATDPAEAMTHFIEGVEWARKNIKGKTVFDIWVAAREYVKEYKEREL